MMGSFLNFIALLFFAHVCIGQTLLFLNNTETSVVNCGSLLLKWEGGTPPFSTSIVEEGAQVSADIRRAQGDIVQTLPSTTSQSQLWSVKVPAAVTSVRVLVEDSQGQRAFPKLFKVDIGTDTSCIAVTTGSSSTPTQSSTVSSASSTASSASSSSASSSASSSTSASVTTSPSSTQSLPTETPKTTVTLSTTSSEPSADPSAGAERNISGAKRTTAIPVIAIVGIAVGGVLVIVALIALIFCVRKRTRSKSDPLDNWDGAYDPESVLKATQNISNYPGGPPRGVEAARLWDPRTGK